jgi:predicted RNA-binding Zn-ribbon protein involved in translation (DUF1610 family)
LRREVKLYYGGMKMKSEKGCPFCLEDIIQIVKSAPPAAEGLQVECDNCGARGPVYGSKEEAITGWELGIFGEEGRLRRN